MGPPLRVIGIGGRIKPTPKAVVDACSQLLHLSSASPIRMHADYQNEELRPEGIKTLLGNGIQNMSAE